MAEYIHLKDALNNLMYYMCGTGYQSTAMRAIEYMPTVDIVFCKDCKYYSKMYKLCSCRSDRFNVYLNDNDYCSHGERRKW